MTTVGGTLQILVLFTIGFLTAIFLRFGQLPAVYVGIILAFSSTMVVVKIESGSSDDEVTLDSDSPQEAKGGPSAARGAPTVGALRGPAKATGRGTTRVV